MSTSVMLVEEEEGGLVVVLKGVVLESVSISVRIAGTVAALGGGVCVMVMVGIVVVLEVKVSTCWVGE